MAKQVKLRKHKLKAGTKIGSLTVVQRTKDAVNVRSPNLKVRVVVDCVCGKRMTIPQYYLTRENPKTHCGCLAKTIKTIHNREYRIWLMMHYRTENPKHGAYKHYKKRGITVHPDFHKSRPDDAGFKAWFAEMGPRPGSEYSCDRINNTLGYLPGNIRWATPTQQRANQGNRIDGVDIVDADIEDVDDKPISDDDVADEDLEDLEEETE